MTDQTLNPEQVTVQQVATVTDNVDINDRLTKVRTIYDASPFEIAWRNFLAGFSRTLGGVMVYLFFVFVIGFIVAQYILPQLKPVYDTYSRSLNLLQDLKSPSPINALSF